MSVPTRDDLARRCARATRAAGRRPGGRRPRRRRRPTVAAIEQRRQREPGDRAAPRGRARDRTRRRRRRDRRRRRSSTVVCSLPRDDVRVGDDEAGRDDEAAALLDRGRTPALRPSRSTRATRASTAAATPRFGRRPGVGRIVSVSKTAGYGASETRRPQRRERRSGGSGATRSIGVRDRRARATARAGQPGALGERGDEQPDQHEHADEPTSAPATPVPPAHASRRRRPAPVRRRRRSRGRAPGRASRAARGTAARRATGSRGGDAAERASTTSATKRDADDEADREAGPRQRRARRSRAASRRRTAASHDADDDDDDRAVHARSRRRRTSRRVGEEAGVRDHAVVGPDRLALDVPACAAAPRASRPCRTATPRAPRAGARPGGSSAGRRAGCRRAAAPARRASRPATARAGRARRGRGRSRRCPRRRRGPRRRAATSAPRKPSTLRLRAVGEVVADLVAGDVAGRPDRAQQRRSSARPSRRPTRGRARPGRCRRASGSGRGPSGRSPARRGGISSTYSASVGRTAMSARAGVVRTVVPSSAADERRRARRCRRGCGTAPPLDEGDEVPAPLGVDEQHPVAGRERAGHVASSSQHRRATAPVAARSRSRQNAHTSPGVGAPHTAHAPSVVALLARRRPAKRSWPRSRKPKRNAAFVPGERSSSSFSTSLYPRCRLPAAIGHSSTL